jgi:hypothetical protein
MVERTTVAVPRADVVVEPVLDEDGLLRMGARWVAISDAQLPIVRLLLEHRDRVVRFEAITEAYVAGGGSGHVASVRTVLSRISIRLRRVGLELVSVRRRGVVLSVGDPDRAR